MCFLHKYHKASGLKLYTTMCREWNESMVNKFCWFKIAVPSKIMFSSSGDLTVVKEYEIIKSKYIGKAPRLWLLYLGAPTHPMI